MICKNCGEPFTKEQGRLFCSRDCMHLFAKKRQQANWEYKNYKPLICPICGISFTPKTKQQKCCCTAHGKKVRYRNKSTETKSRKVETVVKNIKHIRFFKV